MLTISLPMKGAGRENYYLDLAAEDYYAHGLEKPGYWCGKGATRLGLNGKVERIQLRNLLNGMSPDGRCNLVQNAGASDRQRGWDLTHSAPKCVSVLWGLAPSDIQLEIEAGQKAAVARAISHVEREAGITRRGKGGAIKERAELVFAVFQHSTSRELDPQLHTHALLINLGLRADGTTGSLQSRDFFRAKMEVGKVYRNELASQLQERLGLEILPERVGFHIRGVPKELCREFSKRRRAVEAMLAKWGAADAVSAKCAAILSRSRKTNVPQENLFPKWQKVGESFGWTAEHIRTLCHFQAIHLVANGKHKASSGGTLRIDAEPRKPKGEQSREQRTQENGAGERQDSRPEQQKENSADRKPFVRVEWRLMFPRTRRSKPAYSWIAPRIVIGHGRRLSRWGKLLWKKDLLVDELRLQKRNLFQSAPRWSPARKLTLPVIRIGEPRSLWEGEPLWKKKLLLGDVRVQERLVFPNAPKWSPFHDFKVPALRLVPKSQNASQTSQSKNNSQSHSH